MMKTAETKSRKKLPIPLTCNPRIEDGRCIHSYDNGACKLPDQFMCPYWLWYEREHPDKVGDAPQEMIERIRNIPPASLGIPENLIQIRVKYGLEGAHGNQKAVEKNGPPKRARTVSAGAKGGKRPVRC